MVQSQEKKLCSPLVGHGNEDTGLGLVGNLRGCSLQMLISNHSEKSINLPNIEYTVHKKIYHMSQHKEEEDSSHTLKVEQIVGKEDEIKMVSYFKTFSSYCNLSWLDS